MHSGELQGMTLDAASWWSLNSITPLQGAALLCQFNPDDDANNPELNTTSETGPADFKRLLREFNDVAKHDEKPRSLGQWLDVAHDINALPALDAYLRREVTKFHSAQ